MPDFGIFRGFNEKLFGDKLVAGQLPTQLGLIGSEDANIYLLDIYTGAAAAYSLRQLKSGVTNAIEVRRASDNATQDIGFVNNELDVTTLESFCSGTNGFVTTWYDQSGNGNDATQTTAASQPQIVSSGSVIEENGKPAAQFDGNNDYLNLGDILSGESILNNFTVTNVITGSNTSFIDIYNKGVGQAGEREYGLEEDRLIVFDEDINQFVAVNYSLTLTQQTLIYNGYDTSDIFVGLDNNALITTSIESIVVQNTNSNLYFATSVVVDRFTSMKLQESIFYPSDQSSNRTGIETNINDFYSIY